LICAAVKGMAANAYYQVFLPNLFYRSLFTEVFHRKTKETLKFLVKITYFFLAVIQGPLLYKGLVYLPFLYIAQIFCQSSTCLLLFVGGFLQVSVKTMFAINTKIKQTYLILST